jgi:integrase
MQGRIRRRSKNSRELTLDLGRDSHGNRLRKFENVKGKKADAEHRLRELLSVHEKGLPLDSSTVTVAEFLWRWHRDYAVPDTKPRTSEGYEVIIRCYLVPHLGHLILTKLQPGDVKRMEAQLLESGKSPMTIRHVHMLLQEALSHAIQWGILWRNPAEAVTSPKVTRKAVQPPDIKQVLHILKLARTTPYYTALYVCAYTGCRRGEVLGLRWQDVDLWI